VYIAVSLLGGGERLQTYPCGMALESVWYAIGLASILLAVPLDVKSGQDESSQLLQQSG
jgi:hypothetical protein